MIKDFLETSIVISAFKSIFKRYSQIEQRLIGIWHGSYIYRLQKGFWKKIKICFRYSFLGRITEIELPNSAVLDNSRIAQHLVDSYKRWQDKLTSYSGISLATKSAKDIKARLYLSPVKIISVVVVAAVVINMFLSLFLQKQIGLRGWLLRGLFLFAGVAGLSCKADWPAVKKNSVFLRKIQR